MAPPASVREHHKGVVIERAHGRCGADVQAPASKDALHADMVIVAQSGQRFFADLTGDVIRAGSFTPIKELVEGISAYLGERNAKPRPYTWTAKGEAALEKTHRARAASSKTQVK